MLPMRCENCRFWVAPNHSFEVPDGAEGCRMCKKTGNLERMDRGQTIAKNGHAVDYPVCDLWTGPKFGCVAFEPRDEWRLGQNPTS